MTVSKASWRAFKHPPQTLAVKAFNGESVIVRPISARQVDVIGKRFPAGDDNKLLDALGYMAALISEMVVDDNGGKVFDEAELLADDFDSGTFNELAKIVNSVLGIGAEAKN